MSSEPPDDQQRELTRRVAESELQARDARNAELEATVAMLKAQLIGN